MPLCFVRICVLFVYLLSNVDVCTVFNHAEESLQDGSHLFSTQHPVAPTSVFSYPFPVTLTHSYSSVRAAINLEAAGSTGREILFQATSEEMIEAYSHVPRYASRVLDFGHVLTDTQAIRYDIRS